MTESKEKPKCFGHVMDNSEYLKSIGKEPIKDCKICEIMKECIEVYNQGAYENDCYGDCDSCVDVRGCHGDDDFTVMDWDLGLDYYI